jgi:predicted small lipoprotein YifL
MIVLSLGLATVLSACGTKGGLEPPPSKVEAAPEKAKADDGIAALPTLGQKKPEVKPVEAPNQPFLLDFLL